MWVDAVCMLRRGVVLGSQYFFFNDTATTEIYTLSLHDALPIYPLIVREKLNSFIPPKEWKREEG